jgi:hypothetical protein
MPSAAEDRPNHDDKNLRPIFPLFSATYTNDKDSIVSAHRTLLPEPGLHPYFQKEITMAIDPNDAVNIPKTSTGPKTDAGKSKSSRNAIRTGLYAARDFIRPDEQEEYAETLIKLMDELTPEGTMEETFATEIMGATWRLRRCRLVEEAFSYIDNLDLDPMVDERTERQQKSVDRARAQSHLILRRSLAELRKLQTGRTIHEQLADQDIPGLTDIKQVASTLKMDDRDYKKPDAPPTPAPEAGPPNMDALMAVAEHQLAQRYRESGLASFCNPASATPAAPAQPKPMPRNAQCPCGSGAKYKRCCGKNAPAVLNRAA